MGFVLNMFIFAIIFGVILGIVSFVSDNRKKTSYTPEHESIVIKPTKSDEFPVFEQSQQVSIYKWDFENPYDLPDCRAIASEDHKDKRIAVYFLEKMKSSFTADDFLSEDDVGNVNSFLTALENDGWIKELEYAEIVNSLYMVDELKDILRKNNLKVSGRKDELVKRLLDNVPFTELNGRYTIKQYRITDKASKQIQLKKENYVQAIINATHYAESQDWDNVFKTYQSYDDKWGFIHSSGYRHTILATYNVPWRQITFLCSYNMNELNNSPKFKNDLRFFLAASRLRKPKSREKLTTEFRLINDEPINCPNIIDLFQSRDDLPELPPDELRFMKRHMQEKVENHSDVALEYYISLLIYYCKEI